MNVCAADLEKTFHTLNICAADLEKTVYALNCDPSSHRTVLRPCLSKKNSKPVFRRFTLILENREKRKKKKKKKTRYAAVFGGFSTFFSVLALGQPFVVCTGLQALSFVLRQCSLTSF